MADATFFGYQTGVPMKIVPQGDGSYAYAMSPMNGLSIPEADYMALTYSGTNISTIVYKVGGVNGTIVATVALTYDSLNNITSVTRS